jgi:hypothetical protein
MTIVVVQRTIPDGHALDVSAERGVRPAWWKDAEGVTFTRSYVSADRTRTVCLYEAVEAERVARSHRDAGWPFDHVWAARSYRDLLGVPMLAEPGERSIIVVERQYPGPVTIEAMARLAEKAQWCYDTYGIDLIDSLLRDDQRGSVCLYAAPDAESVRRANRAAEQPFDRAWPATVYVVRA